MDSFSHTTVASSLLDYMERAEGVTFDRKAFYFGNLKPDLKGEYLTKRHYPSLMFEEVMQKIRDFVRGFRMQMANGARLSEALGEICHYITDFFSFPHNDTIYEHGLFAHYVYEKRTALCIRGYVSEACFAEGADRVLPATAEELIGEIRKRHTAYTQQAKHGIADDVEKICAILALLVGSLVQMMCETTIPMTQARTA
ncbi:MAG: zinc dependent phospholipase C family protein [Eubacteriales bacterium]|nr:zinc dependent phospholipase C family protein [Eubacteriales bacterium]